MDPDRFKINRDRLMAEKPTGPPFSAYQHKNQPTKHSNKKLVISLIVLVALVIGGGVYLKYHAKSTKAKADVAQHQKVKNNKTTKTTPTAVSKIATASYAAASYGATFNYPTSWLVVNNTGSPLLVMSPTMNLVAADGKSVLGVVEMTLAQTGYLPPAFGTQSVAVLTSQKVNFASPSTTQAAATYISFIQYPSTTTVGGLDGIYVSGNYGYQKYQIIPSSNITSVNPFIDFSFLSCANPLCSVATRQPLTISSREWSNSSFVAPILLMIKSFSFD